VQAPDRAGSDFETQTSAGAPERAQQTRRGAAHVSLVCVSGSTAGTTFTVLEGAVVIGRSDADLIIPDSEVSRRHARFACGPAGCFVEDLGSANGTLLNGTPISRTTQVSVGDRIQLGGSVLVLTQHDELAERVVRMQQLESMAALAGGIAHDFNNALQVIMYNLDVIGDELAAATPGRHSLDEIRAATASATGLAKRLLRLGRPEPQAFDAVDLFALVQRTTPMARKRTKAPIEIVVEVAPDLRALGSFEDLHHCLLNLCINAIDAMPTGGRLTVSARELAVGAEESLTRQLSGAGAYIELAVSDTGTGMDEATLQRAFEPFFTTKPTGRGTGLGLAMVHQTIRRHHGAIDVMSLLGHGTTFRLFLPVVV
jgi:two-component system cell cycle sensor histidine kinase/response regulator CckA